MSELDNILSDFFVVRCNVVFLSLSRGYFVYLYNVIFKSQPLLYAS